MKWILVITFFTHVIHANEFLKREKFSSNEVFFSHSGKFFSFTLNKDKGFYLSSHCLKNKNNCFATKIFTQPKLKLKKLNLKGGINLGALLCTDYFGGDILVMENTLENNVSICEFSDKSMISTGILEKLTADK